MVKFIDVMLLIVVLTILSGVLWATSAPANAFSNSCYDPAELVVALGEGDTFDGFDVEYSILGPEEARKVFDEMQERSPEEVPYANDNFTNIIFVRAQGEPYIYVQFFSPDGFACQNQAHATVPESFTGWLENNFKMNWTDLDA